jgi:hypothetical protein
MPWLAVHRRHFAMAEHFSYKGLGEVGGFILQEVVTVAFSLTN